MSLLKQETKTQNRRQNRTIEDTETLKMRIDSVSSQASIGSVIVNLISIVDNDDIIFSNGFE